MFVPYAFHFVGLSSSFAVAMLWSKELMKQTKTFFSSLRAEHHYLCLTMWCCSVASVEAFRFLCLLSHHLSHIRFGWILLHQIMCYEREVPAPEQKSKHSKSFFRDLVSVDLKFQSC